MEPATVLIISIGTLVLSITVFSIYTAFGPPSKALEDPYEKHED